MSLQWSSLPDGFCDYHSQKWLEYTGFYHEKTLGDGWMDALHRGDWADVKEAWQRSQRTGSIYMMNSRYRRYDGSYNWFKVRAEPIRDQTGTIIRWCGTNINLDKDARIPTTTPVPAGSGSVLAPERYAIVKTFVSLAVELGAFASEPEIHAINDATLLIVYGAVLIGHAEGRPMNASKLSHYLGVPRTTVLRKLDELIAKNMVERRENFYFVSEHRADHPGRDRLRNAARAIREGARALNEVL